MNLFELKNYQLTFSPQALSLKPFRDIWDMDFSKDKELAIKELSYIYYMCDDRSDFMYELDELERSKNIIVDLQMPSGWRVSTEVDRAMEFYLENSKTTSTELLRSTRGVIKKISGFLDSLNPDERDKGGKLIFSISQIVSSVEKMPKLLKALNEVEKEVIKEKNIKAQSGQRDHSVFEGEGI